MAFLYTQVGTSQSGRFKAEFGFRSPLPLIREILRQRGKDFEAERKLGIVKATTETERHSATVQETRWGVTGDRRAVAQDIIILAKIGC